MLTGFRVALVFTEEDKVAVVAIKQSGLKYDKLLKVLSTYRLCKQIFYRFEMDRCVVVTTFGQRQAQLKACVKEKSGQSDSLNAVCPSCLINVAIPSLYQQTAFHLLRLNATLHIGSL